MSYADPNRKVYAFGSIDFGAGSNVTLPIARPDGKSGRVAYVEVAASEVFTAGGAVQIGESDDLDAYANVAIGTLAAGAALSADRQYGSGDLTEVDIEASDDPLLVTCVATGGTPTGTAYVTVAIDWDL